MANKAKAYVCATALLDLNLGGEVLLYPSMAMLKRERICWKECGIYEIDLTKANLKVKRGWMLRRLLSLYSADGKTRAER